MSTKATKWSGGQVNYYFDKKDVQGQKLVETAMRWISDRTCIRYVENKKAGQRIKILFNTNECSSYVGAPGSKLNPVGEFDVDIGGCQGILGKIIHELMHSLGSVHEQSRLDRDSHVVLNRTAIDAASKDEKTQFRMMPYAERIVPFDYGSVMMYRTEEYGKRVMYPFDPDYEYTMGNRRIAFYDMIRINLFYNCKCPVTLPCQNNGITSPGDCTKCFCPSGFFGRLCNQRRNTDSYELSATNQWIMKTFNFKYKSTGDNYAHYYSTFAYIKAPLGRKIQVKIGKLNKRQRITD